MFGSPPPIRPVHYSVYTSTSLFSLLILGSIFVFLAMVSCQHMHPVFMFQYPGDSHTMCIVIELCIKHFVSLFCTCIMCVSRQKAVACSPLKGSYSHN